MKTISILAAFCAFLYFIVRSVIYLFTDRTLVRRNLWLAFGSFFAIPVFILAIAEPPSDSTTASAAPQQAASQTAKSDPPQKSASQLEQERLAEFENDKKNLLTIEQKLKQNEAHLSKYYGTNDQIDQCASHILALSMLKVDYLNHGKSKSEKELGRRAEQTSEKVAAQCRRIYASVIEERFMKKGLDIKVTTSGANQKQLTIKYALMSQPLVYQFQNEMHMQEAAKKVGFTKLVYTNGFDSSLGQSWTIDLTR